MDDVAARVASMSISELKSTITDNGGSLDGPYQWIKGLGSTGISYLTSQPYMACSKESKEGFCPSADWTCKPEKVAVTCGTTTRKKNGGWVNPGNRLADLALYQCDEWSV